MRKTYFLINLKESTVIDDGIYENTLPPEFADARGEKFIEVRYCYATFDNYLVADAVLHTDLIKRDAYLDSSVSVINVLNNGAKPDKYLYPEGASRKFKVWFTNLNGEKIVPDAFQMKMLLIYWFVTDSFIFGKNNIHHSLYF